MRRCPVPVFTLAWARAAFAALLIGIAFPRPCAAAEEVPAANLESKIKTVLLLKLINFVDWPANAFANPSTPFRIGILGEDPFGTLLEEVLAGETPHGRTIEIRRASAASELAGCHLVFLGNNEKEQLAQILAFFRNQPVLTVSELDQFARQGGMVGFVREKKSVRFEINIQSCKDSALTVSSRLASIARAIETRK